MEAMSEEGGPDAVQTTQFSTTKHFLMIVDSNEQ